MRTPTLRTLGLFAAALLVTVPAIDAQEEPQRRPFLSAGTDMMLFDGSTFRTWSSYSRNYECSPGPGTPDCALRPAGDFTYRSAGFGLGLHGGVGLAMRTATRTITLESRMEMRMRSNDGPDNRQAALPLALGIRF